MYQGDYNFFDYKYNIGGYHGQDFGGIAQYIYAFLSIILVIILVTIFRKLSKEKINKIIKYTGIFMILFYITKTTWESIYDIRLFHNFNTGLLPFDSCSIVMIGLILSGFGKGKMWDMSTSWLMTGSIVGGISTLLYLNAFKYYPFLSFGAFYSMIWHFLMIFIGILIIVSKYQDFTYHTVLKGFLFHLLISLIVISIDFIFDFDFMMYHYLGGIPIFEGIATKLTNLNLTFLNPLLMLLLYFIAFNIIYLGYLGITKISQKVNTTI